MATSSIRENMERTVQATIDGFRAVDYNALRATRSDDFIYQFLPKTLEAPPRNNDEYKVFFDTLFPIFTKFNPVPKVTIYDTELRNCSFYGEAHTESPAGKWSIELVMMLSFDETGEKVTRIDEFFDSAVYKAFFAAIQEIDASK